MIWYPYAQMKNLPTPIKVKRAEGVFLYTEDEKKLIDTTSSWWSCIHGYNHPKLNQAITNQLDDFAHVMLGSIEHKPASELANKLSEVLPGTLDYVFFSDSGSVGVEVSLKMSIQYYVNNGIANKKKVVSLHNSYHGDTFKAMSVGDDPDYHHAFFDESGIFHINPKVSELEEVLKKHHQEIACFIVEPLLQGAGGMKIYALDFLKEAKKICKQYDVILIFDEVATGFGRTGNMFVADLVEPDIIVLGKALTAGYIGHAATVANEKIYNAFLGDDMQKAFMHGPTFMGNALACQVALESIKIFEEEKYLEKVKNIESYLLENMTTIKSPYIEDIRILGAMGCIEINDPKILNGLNEFAFEKGIFIRPFLSYIYIMPPYIITNEELEKVINMLKEWFWNKDTKKN